MCTRLFAQFWSNFAVVLARGCRLRGGTGRRQRGRACGRGASLASLPREVGSESGDGTNACANVVRVHRRWQRV